MMSVLNFSTQWPNLELSGIACEPAEKLKTRRKLNKENIVKGEVII